MPLSIIQSMMRKTMFISQSDLPQKIKDDAINIFKQSVNLLLNETNPQRINQLFYEELKKKQVGKLNAKV